MKIESKLFHVPPPTAACTAEDMIRYVFAMYRVIEAEYSMFVPYARRLAASNIDLVDFKLWLEAKIQITRARRYMRLKPPKVN